jgi:hypothetical protein
MSSIFFVLKVTIFTFLLVMLLQVQVGEKSLESYSHQYIVQASKQLKLNEVAVGIVQFMSEAQNSAEETLKSFWQKINKSGQPSHK